MPRWLAGHLTAAEQRLLALREALTPGQRWTSALALLTACSVIVLGRPR
jgi:hypothetical protein